MSIALLLISVLIAALALKGIHFQRKWPFVDKPSDVLVAILTIALVILTHISDKQHENALNQKQHDADSTQKTKDNVHKIREDSLAGAYGVMLNNETNRNITTFNKALQDYRLHYDSGQKRIISSLQDSLHQNQSTPFVGLCLSYVGQPAPIYITKSSKETCVNFRFCTTGALANHIYIDMYTAFSKGGTLVDAKKTVVCKDDTKDAGTISSTQLCNNGQLIIWAISDTLCIYLEKKYKNTEGKSWNVKQYLYFVPVTGEVLNMEPDREDAFVAFLKRSRVL